MFCCSAFEQILLIIRCPICFIFKWETSWFVCDAESLVLLLCFIPDSLRFLGNIFHHFASSYSAVQSVGQVKVHNLSQKAEIQTMEAREHLLQPSHKAPCPVSLQFRLTQLESPDGCGQSRGKQVSGVEITGKAEQGCGCECKTD